MSAKNIPLSHAEVSAQLAMRYCAPRYAYFSEVYHSVGGGRRADGIAVALWRSLGLYIHGFEIKTSRADWMREVKNPGKADSTFKYCDFWWLAVTDEKVIREEELPPDWGLLTVRGNSLFTAKAATRLSPDPIGRDFLCSIVRLVHAQEISPPRLAAEFQKGRVAGELSAKYELDNLKREVEQAVEANSEFEKASGLQISRWNAGRIGEAVKAVMNGAHLREKQNLLHLKKSAERILSTISESLVEKA